MSCKCCCTNTLNLCEQNICDGIDLGIEAQIPGAHKLKLFFLGTMIILEQEFSVSDQIIFSANDLNENFQFTAELYDPIGNRINIHKGDIDYDCIRFKTVLGITKSSLVLTSS